MTNRPDCYQGDEMPSSCQDLQCLGHTINGIYLVKGKDKKKIESIYCNFDESSSDDFLLASGVESRLGVVDVKSWPVQFYVQRNTSLETKGPGIILINNQRNSYSTDGVVPWELARLNIGNAMNLETGVFTAPRDGVYHFDFSGMKSSFIGGMYAYLRLNGVSVGSADFGIDEETYFNSASVHSTLQLKKGDRVDLLVDGGAPLYENGQHLVHFSGWLIEEELEL